MSASDAPRCVCGGKNVESARTDRCGEGEREVLYLHYLLKCTECGRVSEDHRLRYLNASGAAGARARHG
jgi:hypothetical protein